MNHSKSIKSTGVAIVSAAVLSLGMSWSRPAVASEPFLGEIRMFGFNFPPRGWAFCDGQLLAIASNTALFSLLGTTYGGDGRTTFALPDLRGRSAIHLGQGLNLRNYRLGERGGAEQITSTINNMPSHTHTAATVVDVTTTPRGSSMAGDSKDPSGNIIALTKHTDYQTGAPNVDLNLSSILTTAVATTTVGFTGPGQPLQHRSPYLVVNFSIALTGIFPSRN